MEYDSGLKKAPAQVGPLRELFFPTSSYIHELLGYGRLRVRSVLGFRVCAAGLGTQAI